MQKTNMQRWFILRNKKENKPKNKIHNDTLPNMLLQSKMERREIKNENSKRFMQMLKLPRKILLQRLQKNSKNTITSKRLSTRRKQKNNTNNANRKMWKQKRKKKGVGIRHEKKRIFSIILWIWFWFVNSNYLLNFFKVKIY